MRTSASGQWSRLSCVVRRGSLGRSLFVALVVVSAASTGVLRGQSNPKVNMFENGGFEQGISGWQPDKGHELVQDAKASRSGNACLTGEVTEPKRAWILRKTIRVLPQNLYDFEIWARATNQTKLVLWVSGPGTAPRRMINAWERIPKRWRKCAVPLSVPEAGELKLEIVAPSSHGANTGRIWIDDIAIYETRLPETLAVSSPDYFSDEPSLARLNDSSVMVAWNSFRAGADSVRAARFVREGDSFRRTGEWQVAGGERTYVLGLNLVSARDQAILVYAAEQAENDWDIHAAILRSDGPGDVQRVAAGAGIDIKPSAVWYGGKLWLAWESNRDGTRRIYAGSWRPGDGVISGEPVSAADVSSYSPSLVVLPNGEACVAWHAYSGRNYDIYFRRRSAEGRWGAQRRLTTSPAVDRHARLCVRGSEVWMVYENAQVRGYRIGASSNRQLRLVRIDGDGGLMAPAKGLKGGLTGRCEAGTPVVDEAGCIWIAHLRPRGRRAGWDPFTVAFTGQAWTPLLRLSGQKGMDRAPALAVDGTRLIAACQSVPGSMQFKSVEEAMGDKGGISLLSVDVVGTPAALSSKLPPFVEPDVTFEAAEKSTAFGDSAPQSRTIEYKGKTLTLVYGDFHEHTDVSQCNRLGDQSIDESYQHMRDIAHLDFAAATDHGYNITPYLWNYTAKLARVNYDPERFITFLGEEWTSTFEEYSEKHPYGFYGHRNLIFSDAYFPRWWNARNRQTPAEVWQDLRAMDADFINIPHQLADTGNVPTDWDFTDETAQPVAEILQVRGSYEYKGTPREAGRSTPAGYFLQDAWARGIVIGVIASPDHGGGIGKACVFTPELTRAAILEAFRARHCFGTSAARVFIDVRVNGHLMGEKAPAHEGKPVRVEVQAECPGQIDRVEVCRNNEFIYCKRPEANTVSFEFVDTKPLPGRSYYYVRIIQTDDEITWTSPVWFGAP